MTDPKQVVFATRVWLTGLLLIVQFACTPPGAEAQPNSVLVDTAFEWVDDSGLFRNGFGSLRLRSLSGTEMEAFVYRSSRFDPRTGRIWFVMHGASRNAQRYIQTAAPAAERWGNLAIALRFPKSHYPSSSDYTMGGPSHLPHREIERLFDAVRSALNGSQAGYQIFGHSAGAQFTHRLLTFNRDHRALGAVAANAGWYTLPNDDYKLPYGVRGVDLGSMAHLLGARLTVMAGARDLKTAAQDKLLRGSREAMATGENRVQRARHYFAAGQARAAELATPFAWRLAEVPRARHNAAHVIDSAANLLFGPGDCVATPAHAAPGVQFVEILADPPRGAMGDANGDGERDPTEDEFAAITNTGMAGACLSGWTLGDAKKAVRHLFPLGTTLAPGQTLIVFGGGVPRNKDVATLTAVFGGKLSLTNDGDVVTLRDADDRVVRQVSWGDCAGAPCAIDHIADALDIAGAVIRDPRNNRWRPRTAADDDRLAPSAHFPR